MILSQKFVLRNNFGKLFFFFQRFAICWHVLSSYPTYICDWKQQNNTNFDFSLKYRGYPIQPPASIKKAVGKLSVIIISENKKIREIMHSTIMFTIYLASTEFFSRTNRLSFACACAGLTEKWHSRFSEICAPNIYVRSFLFRVWRWCECIAVSHIIWIYFRYDGDGGEIVDSNSNQIRLICIRQSQQYNFEYRRKFHSHLIVK